MHLSEAWELFGEANGAASLEQMRARIGHYRRTPIGVSEDPVIGCLFIGTCVSSRQMPLRTRLPASPPTSCRARAMNSPIPPSRPTLSTLCSYFWRCHRTRLQPALAPKRSGVR
jgi:hypothetical protein